ncbi:unnamed protein product [Angiostrongylus costaricensis]|uniref:Ethylmalonyl-CoA decarboxylase n=1 Tax=Angiostrongylus costaricensis TaxID=334426 RepID=A0A3P7HZI4_ANGCS|nr:unnamed protein product [Angiostrongylus costaricensis]
MSSQLAEILHKWPGGRIDLTSSDDIARLVLNRPEKSNCLSGEMMLHFGGRVKRYDYQVFKELSTFSSCGVLVFEGAGRSFCSGAELGLIEKLSSPSLGSEMFRYMSSVLATIRSSSMVSVARLHGHCLGGATELVSSCDIRVAHKETKIGFLQSRMGIVPSWGGAAYLESIIGRGAALRVMTTAPILTAAEAKDIGFVDMLYDTEEAFEEFVASMTRNGVDVCKAQKSMLNAYREGNPDG